jgi:YfiH family protein
VTTNGNGPKQFELRESDGITYAVCLPFEAEGFTAAFSTRAKSEAGEPFDATAARFLDAIGRPDATLATCKQVHGAAVKRVNTESEARETSTACDALTSRTDGILLGVKTADCVPVLVADTRTSAVAAIHAGWRGTTQRIVERAFATMAATWSTRRTDCIAAIGPAVCGACYEVGPEVLARFKEEFPYAKRFLVEEGEKGRVDLKTACAIQLELCGFAPDQIFVSDLCTICRNDLFFSYRKEGAKAGRILSVVGTH